MQVFALAVDWLTFSGTNSGWRDHERTCLGFTLGWQVQKLFMEKS